MPLQGYLSDEVHIDQKAMTDDAELEDSYTGRELVSEEVGNIDEAPEWDNSSSDEHELKDNDAACNDDVPAHSGFNHVNQVTVTRSGRKI